MRQLNIYEEMARKRDEMSKTQKKIADYILEHQVAVSFYTVGKLAKEANVSEASVVRFANSLGYDGYTALQKEMQEKAQDQMDTSHRLALSYSAYDGRDQGVSQVFSDDVRNLTDTLHELDLEMFFKIVEELTKAQRIFIVASRSSMGLGIFFQYYLKLTAEQVYLIEDFQNNEHLINSLNEKDFVFAISFKRYTKRTVDILQYIAKKECKVACLTDFLSSPLIPYADYYLLAKAQMSTYLDSFVAPQAIIDALLMAIGKEKNKELEAHFLDMEEIWSDLDVFCTR